MDDGQEGDIVPDVWGGIGVNKPRLVELQEKVITPAIPYCERDTFNTAVPHFTQELTLLVAANLSDGGVPRLQKLYEWLDANAINVAKFILEDEYHHVDTLTGDHATKTNFTGRIITNAQDPQIEAIDVLLVLHGLEGKSFFDDGGVKSSNLRDEIKAANIQHRLRLLYSTACYRASHAQDFVDAGFRTASGALKVCANDPYDYPAQLINWKEGKTYKSTVKAGNNPIWLTIHEKIAEALGFDDVDSEKIIKGKEIHTDNH